jgi:quinol monooxygenase YgiN
MMLTQKEQRKVVCTFSIKEGKREEFMALAQTMVQSAQKEAGCLQFNFHADKSDADKILLFEVWESQDHLTSHLQSDAIKTWKASSGKLIHGTDIHVVGNPLVTLH